MHTHRTYSLRFRCIAVYVEHDTEATKATMRTFPNAVHLHEVEELSAEMLAPVLEKRQFVAVLFGGGAPCLPIAD